MADFGFKLSKSSTLDLDKVDLKVYNLLCKTDPDIKTCMACGSCSATCTAAPFSGMSMRKVILALQRGQDVRPMLGKCMLCGKCTMVCPRAINTRHLILSICKCYD
ncbi:MAG: 4Fe-4S dicluster domain-containing protein [Bacteroidales bacterium]|nr:4Fe-4S dicluster domain-containing protein [Candidatus Cryptobacteroides faecihippi]